MQKLIDATKAAIDSQKPLGFSVYRSYQEQQIFNAPFIKPLLVVVLSGRKELAVNDKICCPSGHFMLLSNTPKAVIRNIPRDEEYFALLIEFEYSDFDCFQQKQTNTRKYCQGAVTPILEHTLMQFIEWSAVTSPDLWHLRRQEILRILVYLGFHHVVSIIEPPTLSHKVHAIISANISDNLHVDTVASMLATSESTLRRKLNLENNSFQAIKHKAKLGYGLQLLQTNFDAIGQIAEQCGYSSQSRFTEKFKRQFGITPTTLRKTRMLDLGE